MQCISSLSLNLFSVHAAVFTENPQNTTVHLGEQAVFSCSFKNTAAFPEWTDTDGVAYTISATEGDVRYIQVSNTMVSLNVTATLARDGVCFSCIINPTTGPIIESAQGCLTVAGKQSMCLPVAITVHLLCIIVNVCYCVHVVCSIDKVSLRLHFYSIYSPCMQLCSQRTLRIQQSSWGSKQSSAAHLRI